MPCLLRLLQIFNTDLTPPSTYHGLKFQTFTSRADPLGISASILTALQVATAVVSFIRDLKDASHALRKAQAEIEDLQVVLSRVKELYEKVEIPEEHTEKLTCSHVPLQECLPQLEKLRGKFSSVRGLDRTRRAVTWKFQQGEICRFWQVLSDRRHY